MPISHSPLLALLKPAATARVLVWGSNCCRLGLGEGREFKEYREYKEFRESRVPLNSLPTTLYSRLVKKRPVIKQSLIALSLIVIQCHSLSSKNSHLSTLSSQLSSQKLFVLLAVFVVLKTLRLKIFIF